MPSLEADLRAILGPEFDGIDVREAVQQLLAERPDGAQRIWLRVLDHPPTAQCPEDECMACAMRDCPDHEPLHYHHDGCPICAFREERDV